VLALAREALDAALGYVSASVPDRDGPRADPKSQLHVLELLKLGATAYRDQDYERAVTILEPLLKDHPQVIKVICGHGHFDLSGMLGAVPVQMSGAIAHQLIAGRVIDIAPSFDPLPAPPMLHHWIDGALVSGYYPWPNGVDAERIDKSSNMSWEDLKNRMQGSMAVEKPR